MGKTGRLNLEMNDWMGNQNKKREKLTDSDILKQFEAETTGRSYEKNRSFWDKVKDLFN
mgnify:CR=1